VRRRPAAVGLFWEASIEVLGDLGEAVLDDHVA
jgi:hypothetical protein